MTDPTDNQKSDETKVPPTAPTPIYELAPPIETPPIVGLPLATELPKGKLVSRSAEGGSDGRRVGKNPLLDDFDEDADFSKDPAVDRALGLIKPGSATGGDNPLDPRAMVKPGFGTAEQMYMVAAGVALAAVITAGVTAASRGRVWYADSLLTIYMTGLHALTGAAAVMAAAHLGERRLGELPLATARMALAVALFQLVFHLNIPLSGRYEETLGAMLAYVGAVWALFRWNREQLTLVVALHAAMWLAIYLAAVLWSWSFAPLPPVK